MKTWVRHSLNVGALTAGALLVTGSAAQADPTMISTGNSGPASGVQALLPIQAPIDLCGNAVAAGGVANAYCEGGASALDQELTYRHFEESGPLLASLGNSGVASGLQAYAPVQAPVNVCGNAIGVLGAAAAACEGGASADRGDREQPDRHRKPGHRKHYGYGKAEGYGKVERHAEAEGYRDRRAPRPDQDPTLISAGNSGLLAGTQVLAPIQVPINICGNAIGVLGFGAAACEGGAEARSDW